MDDEQYLLFLNIMFNVFTYEEMRDAVHDQTLAISQEECDEHNN